MFKCETRFGDFVFKFCNVAEANTYISKRLSPGVRGEDINF